MRACVQSVRAFVRACVRACACLCDYGVQFMLCSTCCARSAQQENLSFEKDFNVSFFETSIRVLGGLLSS